MVKAKSDKMKILFFIDTLGPGGKERRFVELIKGLKKSSTIEFEIVIMSNDIHYKEIFDLNIKIHYIIRKTKKDLSAFHKFYKICKNYRPNIVHCWDSMTAIYALQTCKLFGIKLVNGMIADAPEKLNIFNKSWFRARITFPFSNAVIGNSIAGLKAYKAPKSKSFVIHNGFNFVRIENIESPEFIRKQLKISHKFIIGMVASHSKLKDYKTYIEAAQLVLKKRNDSVFLLIGQNTESITLMNQIANENRDNFRFLGKKSDIESFINAMDICVLATFTEGISNAILEYMAMGKPVVATEGGGTIEIVKDQKTGFLVKTSHPDELANKIEFLLNNSEIRIKMGKTGKERIKNLFSLDRMVEQYISIYQKLHSPHQKTEKELIFDN